MISDRKLVFKGDPLEAMTLPMSKGGLNGLQLALAQSIRWHPLSPFPDEHTPITVDQQLVDDLADLREGTTIVGNDPADVALFRRMQPLTAPGATLPWPPLYAAEPMVYDFYADRYVEESPSSPSSLASEPQSLFDCNPGSIATETEATSSPIAPHLNFGSPYQGHSPTALDPSILLDHRSLTFQPKSSPPSSKIVSHVVGENSPFDPFSYEILYPGNINEVRSIDMARGTIYAPVPRVPTAAALANFEIMALVAMVPEPDAVFENRPDLLAGNDKKRLDSALLNTVHESSAQPQHWPVFVKEDAGITVPFAQRSPSGNSDVLYETGPQIDLVSEMVFLLSMVPGPLKDEKMKQSWSSSGSSSASNGQVQEMSGDEVFEALVPFQLEAPAFYPIDSHHRSLLHILSKRR
ncbi:hypothetical protein DXG01_006638 [Tephrocybe rancida]|nr:hypothetical protein DXG01_006638 [Tephrocybe rancida]